MVRRRGTTPALSILCGHRGPCPQDSIRPWRRDGEVVSPPPAHLITATDLVLSRADVLFLAMVSGYGHDHLKHMLPRAEQAIKLARSAGDRIYEGFGQCYSLATRLLCAEHRM